MHATCVLAMHAHQIPFSLFCTVLPPRVCSADCSDGDILQCWIGPNVPKTTNSWISILKLTIRGTMQRKKLNIFPVRFIIIAGNAVMLMKSTNYQNFIATHYQNQMNLEWYIPTLYIYYWSLKNLIWLKMLGNVEASSIIFLKHTNMFHIRRTQNGKFKKTLEEPVEEKEHILVSVKNW